ncbi:MAG: hypothetical protein II210_03000, partial [Rikenellaceae bacterium]|nr:hypothetical protein [Rikenellaceae bacterium]
RRFVANFELSHSCFASNEILTSKSNKISRENKYLSPDFFKKRTVLPCCKKKTATSKGSGYGFFYVVSGWHSHRPSPLAYLAKTNFSISST